MALIVILSAAAVVAMLTVVLPVLFVGRRLYGDLICFTMLLFPINFVDTSEWLYETLTHDLHRLAIEQYEEIFGYWPQKNLGPKT